MTTCVSPEKVQYASRGAARRAIRGIWRDRRDQGGRLVAYACGGHWHVGHNRPPLHKRARRASRSSR